MNTIKVKFSYNGNGITTIKIGKDSTVGDFLSEVHDFMENDNTNICAFLKGNKLIERELLSNYLTNPSTDVIIVVPEGTSISELPFFDLDKYNKELNINIDHLLDSSSE